MKKILISTILLITIVVASCGSRSSHDGNRLWMPDAPLKAEAALPSSDSLTIDLVSEIVFAELEAAGLSDSVIIFNTNDYLELGPEGYAIVPMDADDPSSPIVIDSPGARGILYGTYRYILMHRLGEKVPPEGVKSSPAFPLRILNHWDNLDGTIERGYAGHSLWNWDELPEKLSPRYTEYARANASIGINGTVLNNVNASPKILSTEYLKKVAAIAGVMRPYGIRVYLSVNFASPMALDSLPTADPLDPAVVEWWTNKADEIYDLIPDFGGFLVKANSEGQPGPCDFGRSHADGANMLARALAPHNGIVMWRAFVYSPSDPDRAKQAYLEFVPLDGEFDPNVIIQIKNGPVDFQPREPYSPLFDGLHSTPTMAELQITQEYLGQANHLAYLAPMWKEFFSYVSPDSMVAVAGVANIGDDENWTGNPMAQANWWAFGRLAWNPDESSADIADEWLRLSAYASEPPAEIHQSLVDMMEESREDVVNYMMPLGLHHLFAFGHHYGPEPWCNPPGARADWLPSYYHRADSIGLGFNRSSTGSNATTQYAEPFASLVDDITTCPDEFLLWFHHVPWDHCMTSGNTLWEELCYHYDAGVKGADNLLQAWRNAKPWIKPEIYSDVESRITTQTIDARWWRDACLEYFRTFSGMDYPADIEKPQRSLDDMMKVNLGISNYENPSPALLDSVR